MKIIQQIEVRTALGQKKMLRVEAENDRIYLSGTDEVGLLFMFRVLPEELQLLASAADYHVALWNAMNPCRG